MSGAVQENDVPKRRLGIKPMVIMFDGTSELLLTHEGKEVFSEKISDL